MIQWIAVKAGCRFERLKQQIVGFLFLFFGNCSKPFARLPPAEFGMWVGMELRTYSDTKLIEMKQRRKQGEI